MTGRAPQAAAALCIFWLAVPALAGTDVYIGVAGAKGGAQLSLGLPPFVAEKAGRVEDLKLGYQLRSVIREDLLFSRHFRLLDPPSAAAAADPKAAAEEWKKAAAQFVLTAKVGDLGPKVSISAAAIDLGTGEAVLERYYRQEAPYWRSAAHRLADDLVRQLTGKPGIAHSQLAFVNDQTGHKEIYVVDYDGDGLKRLTNDNSIDLLPRWSPNGRKILYTTYRYMNPDLFEIDLEKGSIRALSDHQGLNVAGGFSPDGSQLVMTMSRENSPNLYLMSLADRSSKALTTHFGVDTSPTFSPDGNQVAFVSDRSGNPQIHILDLTTGKIRKLTRLNWCDSPAWSPSGEWIVFSGRAEPRARMDIYLVDITGSQQRQLTRGEGSNEDPAWSPDGRFIAFTTTRRKRREVFVMDADGSAPHAAADIPGNSYTPSWSQ